MRRGIVASSRQIPPLSATWFNGPAFQDANTNTKTFNNVPIGTASDNRTIVLAIGNRISNGGLITEVSIAGIIATIDVQTPPHTAAAIARAQVPASAGTTTTVVIKKASTEWVFGIIGVWYIDRPITLVDSKSQFVPAGTLSLSQTITTAPNGLVLAASEYNSAEASWSWDAPLTKRVDTLPVSGIRVSAADTTSNGSNVTVTASVPTAPSAWAGLAVAAYK